MYDFILYIVTYSSTDILLHWPHISGCIPVLAIQPVFSHFIFVLPCCECLCIFGMHGAI